MATPYTTLTRLGLYYVSKNQSRIEDTPKDSSSKEKDDSTSNKNDVITQEKGPTKSPKEINFMSWLYFKRIIDLLYDMYCPTASSSKFWNALECTNGEEDIVLEKCTVDSFNNYNGMFGSWLE